MSAGRARRLPACAAAVLAVALLAFAVVKSTVMQAEAQTVFGRAPICSVATQGGADADPRHAALAACGFCAAAAHAPVQAYAPPLRTPRCVRWRAGPPGPAPALRQPPAPAPKARGPPEAV